jgi:hypothetical protein
MNLALGGGPYPSRVGARWRPRNRSVESRLRVLSERGHWSNRDHSCRPALDEAPVRELLEPFVGHDCPRR